MAKISDPDEWTITYDSDTKDILMSGGWSSNLKKDVKKYPRRKLK